MWDLFEENYNKGVKVIVLRFLKRERERERERERDLQSPAVSKRREKVVISQCSLLQ